jgi:MarR family transcriptional regulator, organic hydroperoxide resistance regulator
MISLAETLRCHDSNVAGLVDELEARGLVVRRGDPNDRRVKLIALTTAGEDLRERLLARLFDPPSFIASLEPADERALCDVLRRARG